jgi:hypothetical protein
MSILIIDEPQRLAIRECIAKARANPLSLEILKKYDTAPKGGHIALKDRKEGPDKPITPHVKLPIGFLVHFSIQEQRPPVGWCKQLSISAPEPGRIPKTEVVVLVAKEFGINMEGVLDIWTEEFKPGHEAVCLLALDRS